MMTIREPDEVAYSQGKWEARRMTGIGNTITVHYAEVSEEEIVVASVRRRQGRKSGQ